MNNTIIELTKSEIKKGLSKCTNDQQHLFKRMYSHNNLDLDINTVVDNMDVENLDTALSQIERTLAKQN